jgi:type VI secretion system protein ImpH
MYRVDAKLENFITEELLDEAEFFAIVRYFERCWYRTQHTTKNGSKNARDIQRGLEFIHFRSDVSLHFPYSDISKWTVKTELPQPSIEVEVSFWGLIGALSVLPVHLTCLARDYGDEEQLSYRKSLRQFLSIFENRSLYWHYRTLEAQNHLIAFETSQFATPSNLDANTAFIDSLVGSFIPSSLQEKFSLPIDVLRKNACTFLTQQRPAKQLGRLLQHTFEMDAEVVEFVGNWIRVPENLQSRFGDVPPELMEQDPLNSKLGMSASVGDQYWSVQNRFRVRFGPLKLHEFLAMLPHEELSKKVAEFTEYYAGPHLDFDFQLLLLGEEVPLLELGNESIRLGWSTWLFCSQPSQPVGDCILEMRS